MYKGKWLSPERSDIIGKSRDYNDYCCLCLFFIWPDHCQAGSILKIGDYSIYIAYLVLTNLME